MLIDKNMYLRAKKKQVHQEIKEENIKHCDKNKEKLITSVGHEIFLIVSEWKGWTKVLYQSPKVKGKDPVSSSPTRTKKLKNHPSPS